jgi:hypothetical protein
MGRQIWLYLCESVDMVLGHIVGEIGPDSLPTITGYPSVQLRNNHNLKLYIDLSLLWSKLPTACARKILQIKIEEPSNKIGLIINPINQNIITEFRKYD